MLINVPIESLEERYSAAWNSWFPQKFSELGVKYQTVYPLVHSNIIRQGQFLDVVGTNIFKSRQIEALLLMLDDGVVRDGDVIFFHDLWFPGIEALFYVRDALGIKFSIAGIFHAGSYDPYDYLAQKQMDRWAAGIERGWLTGVDSIFVATEFHKDLLLRTRDVHDLHRKIFVTGLPIYPVSVASVPKENLIVFPHRLAPEKGPDEFDALARRLQHSLPTWRCVKTKDVTGTKREYFNMLSRAKVAVSFAQQETWGIAQQEALFLDCLPVVPDRLSYQEMYPWDFRYACADEVDTLVIEFATRYDAWVESAQFRMTKNRLLSNGQSAIGIMMGVLRSQGCSI